MNNGVWNATLVLHVRMVCYWGSVKDRAEDTVSFQKNGFYLPQKMQKHTKSTQQRSDQSDTKRETNTN